MESPEDEEEEEGGWGKEEGRWSVVVVGVNGIGVGVGRVDLRAKVYHWMNNPQIKSRSSSSSSSHTSSQGVASLRCHHREPFGPCLRRSISTILQEKRA